MLNSIIDLSSPMFTHQTYTIDNVRHWFYIPCYVATPGFHGMISAFFIKFNFDYVIRILIQKYKERASALYPSIFFY